MMRKVLVVLTFAVFSSASFASYSGVFDLLSVGGKPLGKGGAYTASGEDSYTVFYNPACLANLTGLEFGGSYSEPFGVSGLVLNSVVASFGVKDIGTLGAGFVMKGSSDALMETTSVLGFGRDVSEFVPVNMKVGLGVKMIMLKVNGYASSSGEGFKDSANALTLNAGTLFSFMNDKITVGLMAENLVPAKVSFFEGGEGESIPLNIKAGFSWWLNEYFRLNIDYSLTSGNYFIGSEIPFFGVWTVRAGFDSGKITLGASLNAESVVVDAALRLQEDMRLFYQVDLLVKPF